MATGDPWCKIHGTFPCTCDRPRVGHYFIACNTVGCKHRLAMPDGWRPEDWGVWYCPTCTDDHTPDPGKTAAPALTDFELGDIKHLCRLAEIGDLSKYGAKRLSQFIERLLAENERLEKVRDAWMGKSEKQRLQLANERQVSELLNETNKELRAERDTLQERYSSLSEHGRPSDHERIAELEAELSREHALWEKDNDTLHGLATKVHVFTRAFQKIGEIADDPESVGQC